MVLILGSFPSVVSRKNDFYFSNPQNRMWKVLIEGVYKKTDLKTNKSRTEFLIDNHLGMHDVISSCSIKNSEDSSIREVKPAGIKSIVDNSKVHYVFLIGRTAFNLYKKYFSDLGLPYMYLPSTSPANASLSYEDLIKDYLIIKEEASKDI